MKPMNLLLLMTLLVSLPAALSAAPLPVVPGIPFVLGPGQAAAIPGGDLNLVFDGILSDSRCPLGVVCVWEGDAEAAVAGTLPGGIRSDCILHTSPMFARYCDLGSYRLHLLWIDPYPVHDGPAIDPADYLAHFLITDLGAIDVEGRVWGSLKAHYH